MTIIATNTKGEYGVPGLGVFEAGETRVVTPEIASWLRYQPEFNLRVEAPYTGQPFRDEAGKPRYLGYFGPVDARFGYGGGGITILRALSHLGIAATVNPSYLGERQYAVANPQDLPPDAASQIERRNFVPEWEIAQCLPDAYSHYRLSRRIGWTMWEMDRIPDGSKYSEAAPFGDWAEMINADTERL